MCATTASVGSDAANNKTTYVSLLGLDGAEQAAAAAIAAAKKALQPLDGQGLLLLALTEFFCKREN